MKANSNKPPSGLIRRSQIVSTFGPGAMVDLPKHSVLIGGLEHWSGYKDYPVYEERLAARVAEMLDLKSVEMYAPPVDSEDPDAPRTGIGVFLFPRWFLAQVEKRWGEDFRTRPLVPLAQLRKGKYLNDDRKLVPVVPVRFVQACVNGHLSDIDWRAFVHGDPHSPCAGQLWLDEGGSGNDLSTIFVRCEACGQRRTLSAATVPGAHVLGPCRGERPWLGFSSSMAEKCESRPNGKPEYNRLLVRSASNAFFPQVLTVISIPDPEEKLRKAVDEVYEDYLQTDESLEDIKRDRKKPKVANALEGFSDEVVWKEVSRRKAHLPQPTKGIKQAEIEALLASPVSVGEDVPDGDFYARARSLAALRPSLAACLDRIVLVHRLRVVEAMVGFTRFEAAVPDVDGELELEVRRADLAQDPSWVPAVENHGEGVFLSIRKDAIDAWLARDAVKERGRHLAAGFDAWKRAKHIKAEVPFPGLPYLMLHSLSHLLITAVSLEAGYAVSAIRERIYAGPAGYGILLYTGAPGSEGTLGGLVEVGRRIEVHLEHALETGRLCSNDPVCAGHAADNVHEGRFLHGAACHGCLLIAETCCEMRNEYLDRALVVPTVEDLGAEFFTEEPA